MGCMGWGWDRLGAQVALGGGQGCAGGNGETVGGTQVAMGGAWVVTEGAVAMGRDVVVTGGAQVAVGMWGGDTVLGRGKCFGGAVLMWGGLRHWGRQWRGGSGVGGG